MAADLAHTRGTRAHAEMLKFKIGDRVSFQPEGQSMVIGMLTRYNKKTVTVITNSGQRWNVAPGLLREPGATRGDHGAAPNVIQMHKE